MILAVGSTNPVKVNSAVVAASETWPEVRVKGFEVESGISEQPMSDDETRKGAQNRSQVVYKKMLEKLKTEKSDQKKEVAQNKNQLLGLGLEGGVFQREDGELWSTVWVVVWDGQKLYEANGARFKVPDKIAKPILQGEEMGPVVSELFGGEDIKRKNGAIGVVTNNFVDRTEEYAAIVKLALGLWYGREWEKTIK